MIDVIEACTKAISHSKYDCISCIHKCGNELLIAFCNKDGTEFYERASAVSLETGGCRYYFPHDDENDDTELETVEVPEQFKPIN